jgi:Na+-driven multidrug efflux pump
MALFVEAAAPYGAAAVAAQGIALRLTLVAALPLLGLVAGAQVVFGHAAGAGLPQRLRRALAFTVATSLAYGLAAGCLMIALAGPLVGLFAQEAETVRAGVEAVSVFALAFLPIGLQLTAAALFQAIGAPRRAAAVSLAAQGLALIPPLLILPPLLGYEGVLVSRVVAEYLADGLGLVLLLAWAAGARRTAGAARIEGREAMLMPAPHEAAHQGT